MLPADAQMHVIAELLTELVESSRRSERLLERAVLLLGEQRRAVKRSLVRPQGTMAEYARELASAHRQAHVTRAMISVVRWLASKGGAATKTEWTRRYNASQVAWEAALGLEKDGLITIAKEPIKAHGRAHTILRLTSLANSYLEATDPE